MTDSGAPKRDDKSELEALRQRVLQLEEALALERKTKDEAIKTKNLESLGILAGGIAHDFNNLLAVILGNISLLKRIRGMGIKEMKHLERVETAVTQAKDLTSQLLTFAKGGAPVYKTVSISRLIKNVTGHAISGVAIKCRYRLNDELAPVHVDQNQLSIAVRHIITNAMEAMPNGGVITITGKNIEISEPGLMPPAPKKYVKISIQDEGAGIPEEHLKNIFDPYFTTKPPGQEKGMGLGLPIAYSVIKKHGGFIDVISTKNAGTEVDIHIPAAELLPGEKIEIEAPEIPAPLLKKKKILVMDDEHFIREMMKLMTEELGYACQTVSNGDEAVQCYIESMEKKEPFDLVVLDLTVKDGMGGKNTIKKLLELNPGIDAVVSSGFSHDEVLENFREYGFKAVLPKPFTIEELESVLEI